MEVKIIEKKDNLLLSRKEVIFEVEHMGGPTPSKLDVVRKIISLLNLKEDLTVIKDYVTHYGKNISKGYVFSYKDEASLLASEHKKTFPKIRPKEKQEEKAPEGKEEPPKEEPKVETKAPKEAPKDEKTPEGDSK